VRPGKSRLHDGIFSQLPRRAFWSSTPRMPPAPRHGVIIHVYFHSHRLADTPYSNLRLCILVRASLSVRQLALIPLTEFMWDVWWLDPMMSLLMISSVHNCPIHHTCICRASNQCTDTVFEYKVLLTALVMHPQHVSLSTIIGSAVGWCPASRYAVLKHIKASVHLPGPSIPPPHFSR
jgi:hypothetical protein